MKKDILIAIIFVVVISVGFLIYFTVRNNNKIKGDNQSNINSNKDNNNSNSNSLSSKKILVVYYSAQNHTEKIAKEIASNLNADIFEIEPKEEYTSDDLDWTNSESRVSKEHSNESLRNVELKNTKVENFDGYDTVLIGYPIWWGVAAWPVNTFVKANDFSGKTVIPFCTSSSSGIGNSGKVLEDLTKSGNWKDGQRFSSNASSSEIKAFTDSILN